MLRKGPLPGLLRFLLRKRLLLCFQGLLPHQRLPLRLLGLLLRKGPLPGLLRFLLRKRLLLCFQGLLPHQRLPLRLLGLLLHEGLLPGLLRFLLPRFSLASFFHLLRRLDPTGGFFFGRHSALTIPFHHCLRHLLLPLSRNLKPLFLLTFRLDHFLRQPFPGRCVLRHPAPLFRLLRSPLANRLLPCIQLILNLAFLLSFDRPGLRQRSLLLLQRGYRSAPTLSLRSRSRPLLSRLLPRPARLLPNRKGFLRLRLRGQGPATRHPRIKGLPRLSQLILNLVDRTFCLRPLPWIQLALPHSALCRSYRRTGSPQSVLHLCPALPHFVKWSLRKLRFSPGLLPLHILAQGHLAFPRRHRFPRRLVATQRRTLVPHDEVALHLPFPGSHHIDPTKVSSHPARTDRRIPGGLHRRGKNMQGIIVQPVTMAMHEMIMRIPKIQSAGARRAATVTVHPRKVRTAAVHPPLVHRKPGHITRIDDNGRHAHARNAVGLHRLIKVIHRNKVVAVRCHIVGQIDPRIVVVCVIIQSLRRQRGPAQVVVILAP